MTKLVLELNDAAETEFYNIVEYYKQFDRSLSSDFIEEFGRAAQRLLNFPNAGNPYLHNTRRILLNRFPYAVVYKVYQNEVIVVYAVMHMKRKPGYWKKRMK